MSWLDNYSTTNTFRSMYIDGFMDISGGRLQTRSSTNGHLLIAGDTSLNGNLYVGGDISWNPTSLANDSIPSSAIIGGVGGSSAWTTNNSDIYFSGGNVGIGTSSPTSNLHIHDNTLPLIRLSRDDDSHNGFQIYSNSTAAYLSMKENLPMNFETNLSTKMTILGNGNVGIGIDNPQRHLTIYHTDNPAIQLTNSSSGTGSTDGMAVEQYGLSSYITNKENGNIHFRTQGDTIRMTIQQNGYIGIGTTAPRGLLEVANTHGTGHNGADTVYFRTSGDYFGWRHYSRWNRSWDFMFQRQNDVFYVYFQNSTSRGGYFDPNANVAMFDFTGQHRGFVEDIPSTEAEDYKGLIVCANKNTYYDIDYSIKTGKDAIKINESLPYVSLCKKEKDKSCYGVISDGEEGETRNNSSGTFVSVSEKQYGDNRMFINSVGEGAIWVSNKNGNLESGDYITTSNITGYGQKQDDDFLHNYTVAKITMDCDFQPDYIYKKKVTTRNVDITGPDASGNYYDILNNERLYTIDLSNDIVDNENKKYMLIFDDANNLISATQNVLNEKGQLQWEDTTEQEYAYDIRYVDSSGNIITKEQHDSANLNNNLAYIAAFVGCTYHCG